MNKIILLGNLTKDVEVRYTSKDLAVGRFGIAVKRDYKNANDEYETDFANCVVYGQLAETMSKYFKKGSRILVEGRLQSGSYDKDDGTKVYTTDVIVEKINFVDSKKEQKEETPEEKELITTTSVEIKTDPYAKMGKQVEIDDVDLPF